MTSKPEKVQPKKRVSVRDLIPFIRNVVKNDRWENGKSGFGGRTDSQSNTAFFPESQLSRQYLTNLYQWDWIARKAVDMPAKDATREWVNITHPTNERAGELIFKELDRLNVRAAFQEGITLSRLFGGAVAVIGAWDSDDMREPLNIKAVKNVTYINVIDRWMVYPSTYYSDPREANFGQPQTYMLTETEVGGTYTAEVHESRILRFDGEYLPVYARIRNVGWGDSVIVQLHEALRSFGVSVQSSSSILQDFITMVLKIENLEELMADGNADVVMARMSAAASMRATQNIVVTGATEGIEKQGTPISGMADLIDKYISIVSSATGIPRSRLFHSEGGALAGEGGAGSDLRNYYDGIRAYQRNAMIPMIRRLVDIVAVPIGIDTSDLVIEPNSLWQMSENELADLRLKVAQTDQAYIGMGVLDPDEVRVSRFGGSGVQTRDIVIDPNLSPMSEDADEPGTESTGD